MFRENRCDGASRRYRGEIARSLCAAAPERADCGAASGVIELSIRDLQLAAYRLEIDGGRSAAREEADACRRVADYLRFVADQREEFEARRAAADPNMTALRATLSKVFSPRRQRVSDDG